MAQLTEIHSFRISKKQKETLTKMNKQYKIKVDWFIREAIKEKIEKDYKSLIEKIKKSECPF